MNDLSSQEIIDWVSATLESDNKGQYAETIGEVLNGFELSSLAMLEDTLATRLRSMLPSGNNKNTIDYIAWKVLHSLRALKTLVEVESYGFYRNAKLPEDILRENNLIDYIDAAHFGKASSRPFLIFLSDIQENAAPSDPNVYACIIASSGTGKTQLAATAALTYERATTIYLNLSGGEQRFYRPHDSQKFREALGAFLAVLNSPDGSLKATSAGAIKRWADNSDDGTTIFVHLLYHLLVDDANYSQMMKLSRLKQLISGKKYLVFLDEIPPKDDVCFTSVMCLRDTLRFLGIAPILMSTHPGAQDYVTHVSRGSVDIWTHVLTRLPSYEPFPTSASAAMVQSERPLVLHQALELHKEGKSLAQVVTAIRMKLQEAKPQAWSMTPALQLVQLFCTDLEIERKCFTNAHNLVGHHFGGLVQRSWKQNYTAVQAKQFTDNLSVAPVSAKWEPLLYLALVTWDESMLNEGSNNMFPLVDGRHRALTVREAFKSCSGMFMPRASTANPNALKADGDLLEALVHASLTLASMKTATGTYLGGVPMKEFITLARLFMLPGQIKALPRTPSLFESLEFDWPNVPALGGSNSGLPQELATATGAVLGYLERPADVAMVDGKISYGLYSDSRTPIMSIECKNYTNGVDTKVLKDVFKRIQPEVKCSLVFVSGLQARIFSRTSLEVLKDCFHNHPAIKTNSFSIVVWEGEGEDPRFLRIYKDAEVKAVGKTALLVVIIVVGLVSSWKSGESLSHSPCANLPLVESDGYDEDMSETQE